MIDKVNLKQNIGEVGFHLSVDYDFEPLLSFLNNREWTDWERYNDQRIGTKTYLNQSNDETKAQWDIINSAMYLATEYYIKAKENSIEEYDMKNAEFKISKWDAPMNGMGAHADQWYEEEKLIVPSITCLLYLTEDYEGASLEFPELNKSIKPKSGDLIVFDSKTAHGVTNLISGRRITTQLFSFLK